MSYNLHHKIVSKQNLLCELGMLKLCFFLKIDYRLQKESLFFDYHCGMDTIVHRIVISSGLGDSSEYSHHMDEPDNARARWKIVKGDAKIYW